MENQMISIHAGWLIDGSGAAVQPQMRLDLENGLIRSIRKISGDVSNPKKFDMPVLDFSRCTLLPGLIDCHVHLAMSPSVCRSSSAGAAVDGHNRFYGRILKHLNQFFARGVMGVRDGGDPNSSVLLYKTDPGTGDHPIRLYVAGKARYRPGRYGDLIGCALSLDRTLAESILNDEARVDHIKIVNSGLNSLTCYAKETEPQFDSAELSAAARAAKQRGFKTMVHANGKLPVKIAVDAGCDSIEHGFFMGAENMQRMADSQTTWVPTAFTMKALKQRMQRRGTAVDVVQKNLEHQIEQIQTARELGVRVALGTDAGSAGVEHGQAVIEEMGLFLDAGYSIETVVRCATHNGAMLLGLTQIGQLKENMEATFIAVKGEPSQLPESLNQIKMIFYRGKHIDINSYSIK